MVLDKTDCMPFHSRIGFAVVQIVILLGIGIHNSGNMLQNIRNLIIGKKARRILLFHKTLHLLLRSSPLKHSLFPVVKLPPDLSGSHRFT